MKTTHSLAQLQKEHVVLELECIDRMYWNAYVPKLTSEGASPPSVAVTWDTALPPPNRRWP